MTSNLRVNFLFNEEDFTSTHPLKVASSPTILSTNSTQIYKKRVKRLLISPAVILLEAGKETNEGAGLGGSVEESMIPKGR